MHTFTFANAVHQGLRRTPLRELVRGVFDAAMSLYLDRFLNVPAAKMPLAKMPSTNGKDSGSLSDLSRLLDRQQQVIAMLGKLLLREDRDFHTIQMIEAAVRQYELLKGTPAAPHVLIAAARYLSPVAGDRPAPTCANRTQSRSYRYWLIYRV